MNRRKFLKAAGATSIFGILAGCTSTKTGKFKITDLGVTKKHESAATYITVKNIADKELVFEAVLAAYGPDGARVSDWTPVESDEILPGEERSLYVVYDAESVGWFNSNKVGQVVHTHSTKVRAVDDDDYGTGPILDEDAIGKTFKEAQSDAK